MQATSEQDKRPPTPMERLRAVHLQMVDAVLTGDGLERVAQIAAGAAGGPVAIVIPRLGTAVTSGPGLDPAPLRRYVGERMRDRPAPVPPGVAAEVPVRSGDDVIGAVILAGGGEAASDALEFLHLAAVASLTEVAVEEAKEEVEQNLRGSFLEELRARTDLDPHEIVRRAARLGCDLSRGAVVLCAELTSDRPRHVVATISGEYPGALAQHMDPAASVAGAAARVYALLPAAGGDGAPEATLASARKLAARLQRHGTVGLSTFYADPADFGRAIQEAELVLDVLRRSDGAAGPIPEDIGTGTYRLLFRVLASHPEEVRSFYEDTVAPIVKYDDQYATDLVGTLEAYLEQNCNMNATAAAIYAHRHTVAYRLERVKELTGLDPMQSEDRERLGLGLKAYRIIAPRLHR
jgi:sugar diacid utilization regulator